MNDLQSVHRLGPWQISFILTQATWLMLCGVHPLRDRLPREWSYLCH